MRRFGITFVFAATMAGGVLMARPADASTLTDKYCPVLAAKVLEVKKLAAQYPNNKFIAFVLDIAQDAYAKYCH